MSVNTSSNPRAALLSGLRTGGVRSAAIPHTAAPGATFNIPHIQQYPEQDNLTQYPNRAMPMTAAVDGPGFLRQQSAPFSPAYPQHAQAQALQMQMMQIEIMRMQALQAQQYQAQLLAAQNQPQSARRPNFNPPATAGPTASFDFRVPSMGGTPMTAAIDGKFGIRAPAFAPGFIGHFPAEPTTTVISGGTSLGGSNNTNSSAPAAVSKSESASNWRRGGNNNSVLRKKSTSPPPTKARPQGLSINSTTATVQTALPVVAIDNSFDDDGYSTSSSDSAATNSPPTTPHSSSSIELPISKEAVKAVTIALNKSIVSRQPHGPPSGADELGPRNFASRVTARGPIAI